MVLFYVQEVLNRPLGEDHAGAQAGREPGRAAAEAIPWRASRAGRDGRLPTMSIAAAAAAGDPQLRAQPLERQPSLTSRVIERVRENIVSGVYTLGEQLSEVTIAEELGVSRTPVREAFLALKSEGLVEIRPQRGTFVFQLSRAELAALTRFRLVLELGALRLAMIESLDALIRGLQPNLDAMAKLPPGDVRGGLALDTAFHRTIIEAAANRYLEGAYARIAGQIEAIAQRSQSRPGDLKRIEGNHRMILAAIARGDAARAEQELAGHIERGTGRYGTVLPDEPATPSADPAKEPGR
jgi:DNA-binding GntR family transcriptional regulator